jgi:hypothetical protein
MIQMQGVRRRTAPRSASGSGGPLQPRRARHLRPLIIQHRPTRSNHGDIGWAQKVDRTGQFNLAASGTHRTAVGRRRRFIGCEIRRRRKGRLDAGVGGHARWRRSSKRMGLRVHRREKHNNRDDQMQPRADVASRHISLNIHRKGLGDHGALRPRVRRKRKGRTAAAASQKAPGSASGRGAPKGHLAAQGAHNTSISACNAPAALMA